MKTVAQVFAEFEAAVIPVNASPIQRQEMRRSFYAGFGAALQLALQMAEESGDDDDAGALMMDTLYQECKQFGLDVQAGRA
jgi:hypothetical protein